MKYKGKIRILPNPVNDKPFFWVSEEFIRNEKKRSRDKKIESLLNPQCPIQEIIDEYNHSLKVIKEENEN